MTGFMDRLLRILCALLVVLSATAAELRLPMDTAHPDVDCAASTSEHCPCGMPMAPPVGPRSDPQSCCTTLPAPMTIPSRATIAVERVVSAELALPEPRPWPGTWDLLPTFRDARSGLAGHGPVDTGPPLRASERVAHLGVFRI